MTRPIRCTLAVTAAIMSLCLAQGDVALGISKLACTKYKRDAAQGNVESATNRIVKPALTEVLHHNSKQTMELIMQFCTADMQSNMQHRGLPAFTAALEGTPVHPVNQLF